MTRKTYRNPFLIWADLAIKTGEMMLASGQVIGHRTSRISAAGPVPDARDRREFSLMGSEKLEAASESAGAMAMHMMTMNQQLGMRALRQMFDGTSAMMTLAASRTPAQAIARQGRLVQAMTNSAGTAAQLSASGAKLAQRGFKPIHKRATANAKRLRKV